MNTQLIIGSSIAFFALASIAFAETAQIESPRAKLDSQIIAVAKERPELDSKVNAALETCYTEIKGSKDVIAKAAGVLVFPEVTKGGLLLGIESGKGALREGGVTTGYYSTSSTSIGATAGVSTKSLVLAFARKEDLKKFKESSGWKVGVDGAVTLAKVGTGGELDTKALEQGTSAFVYGEKGLLLDVSLDGTKISKLESE